MGRLVTEGWAIWVHVNSISLAAAFAFVLLTRDGGLGEGGKGAGGRKQVA